MSTAALRAEVAALVQNLHQAGQAERAQAMAAYLRGQFIFFGVATPERRAISADLLRVPRDRATLLQLAALLFAQTPRECHYVACDLLRRQVNRLQAQDLPLLVDWAEQGAWWDVVDALVPTIGQVVRQHRASAPQLLQALDEALSHGNFWRRRLAMLHQLGWRLDTDAQRLFRYALHLAPESEFFIRKAIGWALRDYARWAPDAVRQFLREHAQTLSPLSLREAGKHLT